MAVVILLRKEDVKGPTFLTLSWGRLSGLRLLPLSRPTPVSSLGEDGGDSLIAQLPPTLHP